MISVVNSSNFVKVMSEITYLFFQIPILLLYQINANLIKLNANAEVYQNPVKQLSWKILQKVNNF